MNSTTPYESIDFTLGIVIMVTSFSFLTLQIWYCRSLAKHRQFGYGAEFSSVVLIVLAIADSTQLVAHFAIGMQLISQEASIPLIRYFGGLITGGWHVVVISLCFFVLHRFVYLALPFYARLLMNRRVLQSFLFLILLYTIIHMTLTCLWWDLYFNSSEYRWDMNLNTSTALMTLHIVNRITNYTLVFFPLPLYTAMFVMIWLRRKKFSRAVSKLDLWVMLQMLIFWLFAVFSWIIWEFVEIEKGERILLFVHNTFLWILWNGLKPVCFMIASLVKPLLQNRPLPTNTAMFIIKITVKRKARKRDSLPAADN